MLNLFAGSKPVSVNAVTLTQGDQKLHESCDFSVQIHYENGSIGTLLYTDLAHPKFPRERLEVFAGGSWLKLEDYGKAEVHSGKGWKKKGSVDMGHGNELTNFIDVIRGKADPLGNVQDGLYATLIAQAARSSILSGQTIKISGLFEASSGSSRQPNGEFESVRSLVELLEETIRSSGTWDDN